MKSEHFIENETHWLQLEQELLTKQFQIEKTDYPHTLITASFSLNTIALFEVLCHYQQLTLLEALRQELGVEELRYCLARFTDKHHSANYLPLLRYYILTLSKYGASYDYLTVEKLLTTMKHLDFETYHKLITVGSGTLPQVHTQLVTCQANDVLATITIHIKQETEQAYQEAIRYINALLEKGFPKSYAIYYEGESDDVLPIKQLPITSSHHFFAKIVSYPNLHPLLVEYSYKAMAEYHFYREIDEEEAAMPSTFAVFGLGLYDKSYRKLIIDYMNVCDGDHSPMPIYFAEAYIKKFGLTPETLPVFVCTITAVQEIPYDKFYEHAMNTEENLQWLEAFMTTPFIELCPEIPVLQSEHMQEYKDMFVAQVLYTCYGITHLNDFKSSPFMRILEPYRTRFEAIIHQLI